MKYPDLLDQEVSRVGLQESQKYNLLSSRLVTEIVKTSLGPRGMEKMYIDILGEDSITKHGGAFLRKVDVVQPAAKSVIDAVNTVDTHVGDGFVDTGEGLFVRGGTSRRSLFCHMTDIIKINFGS